jgi:hypothetical protein
MGIVEFITTDLLSQNTFDGPSIGMPNILNLYLKASVILTAILSAINSEPNVDDSRVFCDLEYQVMGDLFRYINIPVCERRVILFEA